MADVRYGQLAEVLTLGSVRFGSGNGLVRRAPSLGFRFRPLTSFQLLSSCPKSLPSQGAGGRFAPLLAWAREHLDAPLTVEDMAEQAGMSSRHFARAFIAETGTTPSKAVERLRIEVARQRVQSSSEAIERVAQTTGFRDPERMRRAFIRAFGQPPQSLRRAARAG